MFEVRYGYVQDVLKLLRNSEVFDNIFGLLAEMSIYGQCLFGIYVRHLEVVL